METKRPQYKRNNGRMAKKTVSKLKKKADKIFSEYIRRKSATPDGYVRCVSCSKVEHWKNVDAGHWLSRRFAATRYNENNVWPQCRYCNRFLEGSKSGFAEYMYAHYTKKQLSDLQYLAHSCKQFKIYELEEIIDKYKKLVKELNNG